MNSEYPISKALMGLVSGYKNTVTKKIRPLGLYPGQDLILLCLMKNNNISQNQLVTTLCVDHSTIAKSVSRMTKAGLVKTHKSSKDKRITLVGLTGDGKKLAKQIHEICLEAEKKAMTDFSEEEQRLFLEMLEKISFNLNQ
ncbi:MULTISPECIES: MarR family winged helix-turn-helix transcriptional regulator [unclassified Companilactobacillus]|uniref:MarR family winged helix-turn-helix transcriptional regulator n=1 Tax=unclassified Companilactobacillus TaxID=2767904 RepID=UPI002FF0F2E7